MLAAHASDLAAQCRALQGRECTLRLMFETAGLGLFRLSATGQWQEANHAVATILGYVSPEELIKAQPDFARNIFVDSFGAQRWREDLETSPGPHATTAEARRRDGQTVWIHLSGQAMHNADGTLTGIVGTIHDITSRRSVEQALEHAKGQTDSANRSRSEFLAHMSHELRTPLNAIIGFAEIIKDQLFGPVGQEQYVEYAQDIYDSGHMLLSLINDILDMAKIESGKRALAEGLVDVDQAVQSVMRLMAVRANEGKITLRAEHVPFLPRLRGEERALKQILTNLLSNAVKFTPSGGKVTLDAHVDDQGRLVVSVQDTGIGIAPEDVSTALMPFGQIDSALNRQHEGTGLGLPLTKALVELHGGTLQLDSTPGHGTTMTVVFPADRTIRHRG